jgi:glucose/arabinose dehydrogenase
MRVLRSLSFAALLITATCGGESMPPGPPTGDGSSPTSPISISGSERIGWNQLAADASQASGYRYTAYVDDEPFGLPDAACDGAGEIGFTCVARLPPVSVGPHRIEIASSDGGLESPKSSPIYVVVAMTKAAAVARVASSAPRRITTSDGTHVTVETLATGLDTPSALAATADGRVLIAQGSGDVWVWQANRILSTPAARLADVQRVPGVGLVGMALDAEFAANGRVYVAYVGRARNGTLVNRVVRYRERNNILAESAVILEDVVAVVAPRAPRIRMGPDRKLYVAFPAADWLTADSSASYSGKILRINDDGTTPRDNPRSSPVISSAHASPGGFDWLPGSSRMWLTERDRQGRDVLGFLPPLSDRATVTALESVVDAASAAFHPGNTVSAFANNLFIAGLAGQQLRRVRFNLADESRVASTEGLLEGEYGRFSDVIVGPDGAIYLATSNRGLPSAVADDDRLLRLTVR